MVDDDGWWHLLKIDLAENHTTHPQRSIEMQALDSIGLQ